MGYLIGLVAEIELRFWSQATVELIIKQVLFTLDVLSFTILSILLSVIICIIETLN